jgi:hypothetical protein
MGRDHPRLRRTLCLVALTGLLLASVPGPSSLAAGSSLPAWEAGSRRLPQQLRERMRGVSWHRGCPVPLRHLRLVRVRYVGFDGDAHRGHLVVNEHQDRNVMRALHRMYDARFKIRRMRLIEAYGGSDDASMADNNTSAFNCRPIAGTDRWSEHSYGRAIDINPVQNPYVRGDTVQPEAGRRYLDREDVRKGMIVRPGSVVRAFARRGWEWGGDWQSSKDYQHFSSTGG